MSESYKMDLIKGYKGSVKYLTEKKVKYNVNTGEPYTIEEKTDYKEFIINGESIGSFCDDDSLYGMDVHIDNGIYDEGPAVIGVHVPTSDTKDGFKKVDISKKDTAINELANKLGLDPSLYIHTYIC